MFDIDAAAYLRLPGERSNDFPLDESVLPLTQVDRSPRVGDSFLIWVDEECGLWDYWRQSSPVSAMYRVRTAGPKPARLETPHLGSALAKRSRAGT